MSSYDPLLITAKLASPLAGDAPQLDSMLEWAVSMYHPKAVPGYKITRATDPPPMGALPISLARDRVGEWLVGRCSSPILEAPDAETVEYIHKKLGVEDAEFLRSDARLVVSTTNSWTKSYRLPLRIRVTPRVCWFALGDQREILRLLRRHVKAIGKKVSVGYGVVSGWEVERVAADQSWFAPSPGGPVLMRPLPFGDWLPEGLVGYRRDFCSCVTPYWHPARYAEAVVPC